MIHSAAVWVFWLSAALVVYVYFGYPVTLLLLPRARARDSSPWRRWPRVSVLIAAFNEASVIRRTLENKLESDYPNDLLEIIVVSDDSSDGTDEIVQSFAGRGVVLIRQSPRQGKTTALNRAREAATGEIVVFSDANSLYERTTIRHLVEAFTDPRVGYVTGKLLYGNPEGGAAGGGTSLFMRYEDFLRRLETRAGSIVGVNGGVDAVRRSLYQPMDADQQPDFVLPLRIVAQGARVVHRPDALAFEDALARSGDEFRMRVRVSLRALWALADMKQLLAPRFGRFAFQLLVHKVLRYGLFAPMILALAANLVLVDAPFYRATLAAQALFYAAAGAGFTFSRRFSKGPLLIPYYLVLTNAAAAVAFLRFLRGRRQVTWRPRAGG